MPLAAVRSTLLMDRSDMTTPDGCADCSLVASGEFSAMPTRGASLPPPIRVGEWHWVAAKGEE